MRNFKIWEEVSPPAGVVYHYPPRKDQTTWVACGPAPASMAQQMYTQAIMTKMIARCTTGGDSIAEDDRLGGFRARRLQARLTWQR